MSTVERTARLDVKLPSIIYATAAGVGLGVVTSAATVIGSCVLLLFVIIPITEKSVSFTTIPLNLAQLLFLEPLHFLSLAAAVLIVGELFAVVPAMFGGGWIGLAMRQLAQNHRLNIWSTILVGSLIGLCSGWMINLFFFQSTPDLITGDLIWMLGMAGIVWGLLHSIVLFAWFMKKMR